MFSFFRQRGRGFGILCCLPLFLLSPHLADGQSSDAFTARPPREAPEAFQAGSSEMAWALLAENQPVVLQAPGGRSRVEVRWRGANAGFQWEALRELNERSRRLWTEIESCHGASIGLVAHLYRTNALCDRAAQSVVDLRQNVLEFLRTSQDTYLYPATIECRVLGVAAGGTNYCELFERELGLMRSRFPRYRGQEHLLIDEVERGIRKPSLHPLLIQFLLEAIAIHHPFGSYERVCPPFSIFGCPQPFLAYKADLYISPIMDAWFRQQTRLPAVTQQDLRNQREYLERTQPARLAVRILDFFLFRPSRQQSACAAIGLWPYAARDLATAVVRSGNSVAKDPYDQRLQQTIAESCGPPATLERFGWGGLNSGQDTAMVRELDAVQVWQQVVVNQIKRFPR